MSSAIDAPKRRGSLKSLALIVLLVVIGTQTLQWWRDRQVAQRIAEALGSQRITLYTTQSCIYCHKAKNWLASHDIPWEECDVERDLSCKATFEAQGAPGTPITRVGTHWNLGFDPEWTAQALRASAQARPSTDKSPRP